jgi:glycogen debranching enzyme
MAQGDSSSAADSGLHYSIRAATAPGPWMRRVLNHDDTFAVFDRSGDITCLEDGACGIYHAGTRHLSQFELLLEGYPLILLGSAIGDDGVLEADVTNGDLYLGDKLVLPHSTVHIRRSKFLHDSTSYERFEITNYDMSEQDFQIRLRWAVDFADMFEVRGIARLQRGTLDPPLVHRDTVTFRYHGLDDVVRTTRITLTPTPSRLDGNTGVFRVRLGAKQSTRVEVIVECATGDAEPAARHDVEHAHTQVVRNQVAVRRTCCTVRTSNPRLDAWLARSHTDLALMTGRTRWGPYPYAGVPWFCTPFGRDALLTAWMTAWMQPTLPAGVLRFLAAFQADGFDDASAAEPGKIFHELRHGEMAALREHPFGRYYGSVDATPLFIGLLGAYQEISGDLELVAELWPNVCRALEWMTRWGDPDGDGFVEYGARADDALVNQGWKDSVDSVFHADGTTAQGPIALAEVQGYVYAALVAASRLARMLGDSTADALAERAARLQQEFDAAFWCDDLDCYALALDGSKRPCKVVTSNAGQCLWSGIALPHRAVRVAERMLQPDMFSGWGIRTVSSQAIRYNPAAYHNGSVWPHDNALVALGLARYGLKAHAVRVLEAMLDTSEHMEMQRMPELFCGFTRHGGSGPTLYPVACSPQSWASAAAFAFLQAVIGLSVTTDPARVVLAQPMLPQCLDEVVIEHLRVGEHRVSFTVHRHAENVGVHVVERTGDVEVVVVE